MKVEELLEKLPPAPSGVENWIRKDLVYHTYIIYNNKENRAVCTRCGHTFKADRFYMKHNEKGECPRCHKKATYKAEGVGRKNLSEYVRVLVLVHKGKNVYATLSEVIIDFAPAGKPNLHLWPSAIYFFNENKQVYYKNHPSWFIYPERWERRKNIKLPAATQQYWRLTAIYEDNLKSVFEKSCLKYLYDNDLFENYEFQPEDYIRYISLGLKYQSIELLSKSGFKNIVAEKVFAKEGSGALNWRGNTLKKILRLQRRDIRFLMMHDPDLRELTIFQSLTEKEKKLVTWEQVQVLAAHNIWNLEKISKYTQILKWLKYAENQERKYYFTNDWLDYIKACGKLGMDITSNKVLYPKNFEQAHDEVLEKVKTQEDEARNKAMWGKTFDISIEKNGLVAMMARTQGALNEESKKLNHCVRTYGDRVIGGECYIFFIRKAETPDTSYFTLETNTKGRVRQCRGLKNCNMTEDVKEFVDEVEKDLKELLPKLIKERSANEQYCRS